MTEPSPRRPPREAPSDAELVARVRDGDVGALGGLFDRYDQDVRRVVARLGVAPADVDDLVQATFLDVLHAAASFDGRASAKAWLVGLAVMTVRRHRRSVARMARRLTAWALEPFRPVETPEQAAGARSLARAAERALEGLSPKKRDVFVMVALEGMAGEEAAAVLGIPVATVWTRLHHARRELKEALSREEP